MPPSSPVSFSDSVKSDFASFYEKKPSIEIDMSRYEADFASKSTGVKSPVMGVGMIAVLAGGLFIVMKGLRE
jgi:hypothetical protein